MAYIKDHFDQRVKVIQEIAAQNYEAENHAKCYKSVWRKFIKPLFGIGYRTFLKYLKVDTTGVSNCNLIIINKKDQKEILK